MACQDEAGRLWDVVWLIRWAIARASVGPVVRFGVHVRSGNRPGLPPLGAGAVPVASDSCNALALE